MAFAFDALVPLADEGVDASAVLLLLLAVPRAPALASALEPLLEDDLNGLVLASEDIPADCEQPHVDACLVASAAGIERLADEVAVLATAATWLLPTAPAELAVLPALAAPPPMRKRARG